jgi:hypothetical protein
VRSPQTALYLHAFGSMLDKWGFIQLRLTAAYSGLPTAEDSKATIKRIALPLPLERVGRPMV